MISSWIFVAACFALDSRSLSLDQDADNDSVNWTWRFLRNEVISSHLRFDRILDEAKKEDELYIYLRWEITPMHLAHLLPLALADWLKVCTYLNTYAPLGRLERGCLYANIAANLQRQHHGPFCEKSCTPQGCHGTTNEGHSGRHQCLWIVPTGEELDLP